MAKMVILKNNPGVLADLVPGIPSTNNGDDVPILLAEKINSSTANISFTSISGAYNTLFFYGEIRSDDAAAFDNVFIRMNSLSSAIYAYNSVRYADFTQTHDLATTGNEWRFQIPAATTASEFYSAFMLELPNYANAYTGGSQKRNFNLFAWHKNASQQYLTIGGGSALTSAAITQIDLIADSGAGFIANSWCRMYAI